MPPHTSESPAKKQSKWSPEEDALIIELRGSGMKWDDISKRLPGRSSISCRLHYQNYLERRSEWDEERKNKLARLYERFKPDMWAKVAEEMQVPWRAAEAMHWQLGEIDMARRAGVVPFSLNITSNEPPGQQRLVSPSRGGHGHSQSQGSLPRDLTGLPSPRYTRGSVPGGPMPPLIPPPTPTSITGRPLSSRRESLPPRPPSFDYHHPHPHHQQQQPPPSEYGYTYNPPGPGPVPNQGGGVPLAPIQTSNLGPPPSQGSRGGMLPSVAELTTGVSPYSTPAYSIGGPGGSGGGMTSLSMSPVHTASGTASPGLLPALSPYPPQLVESAGVAGGMMGKRRASPLLADVGGLRETSRRRGGHLYPRGGGGMEEGGGGGGGEYPPGPRGSMMGYGSGPGPGPGPPAGMGPGPVPGMGVGMGAAVPTRRGPRHGS